MPYITLQLKIVFTLTCYVTSWKDARPVMRSIHSSTHYLSLHVLLSDFNHRCRCRNYYICSINHVCTEMYGEVGGSNWRTCAGLTLGRMDCHNKT